jgi:phage/plasmid-like protein (TIGR03299 family)
MAHNIENAMYTGKPAWHGLGTVVTDAPSSAEAMRLAGLDKVNRFETLYYKNPQGVFTPVPASEGRLVIREDEAMMGVLGDDYAIVQNRSLFDFADSLVEGRKLTYETCGSLRGGKRVWLLAHLRDGDYEPLPGDVVKPYLLLASSHDGSMNIRGLVTDTRVVCENTLRAALRAGQDGIKIRHTASAEDRLKEAGRVLGFAQTEREAQREAAQSLTKLRVTDEGFASLLDELMPKSPESTRKSVTDRVKEVMTELFEGKAAGSDIPGVAGTGWGALNAITQWTTHGNRARTPEAKLESVFFGSAAALGMKAQSILLSRV